jgi:hypothetical protein
MPFFNRIDIFDHLMCGLKSWALAYKAGPDEKR